MPLPTIDHAALGDTTTFTGWQGLRIDVGKLYDRLTAHGWKVDTEESDLMNAMSKTWRDAGVKVWFTLQKFCSAPPDAEVEAIDKVVFHRFDPAEMPSGTMHDKLYQPGDEQQPWYASHREVWDWLVANGDPQFDSFDLLTAIPMREVPEAILQEAWGELQAAVVLDEES